MDPGSASLRSTRPFPRPWLAAAGLVVAVFLVYWNSLPAPFLFDDTGAVVQNPTIRHLGRLAVLNPPADGSTTTGRPLVNASFALNYAISGEQVWSYHALNLVIHTLAALALFGVVRRTLGTAPLRETFGRASRSLGLLTALLWAVHPLLTESVVSIAQRTESLCGLFYLLTLYCFVRAVDAPAGGAARRAWLVASWCACAAGMATKEVMATAPLLVLLYDRTFVAGTFGGAWRERRSYYAAAAGTWLLLAWLVLRHGASRGIAAGFGLGLSPWSYLLQQCRALVLYLKLAVWPHPLVLDYGTAVPASAAEVWWQGLLVLGLLAATLWALRRKPALGFAGAAFFLVLAPSSSVIPLVTQTMAEHRMYLPLAALVVLGVLLAHRLMAARAAWLLVAVAVVFGFLTVARNRAYGDTVGIWADTVAHFPSNPRAHNNLGWALQSRGRLDAANEHFARAVALQPGYVAAHYNWGVALLDQGRVPEAIAQFESAVRLAPDHAQAQVNLGNALMQVSRAADALACYETALRLEPAADIHYDLAIALIALDRTAEAATHLRAALQANPELPEAHYQLARVAETTGSPAEAESEYSAALRLDPDHLGAHRKLGLLLARGDRLPAAAEHFRAALRLDPGDAATQANLGNVLLLQGRAGEAVRCYEAALRLRPDDAGLRASLQQAREQVP